MCARFDKGTVFSFGKRSLAAFSFFVFLSCFSALISAPACAAEKTPTVIFVVGDWPPYTDQKLPDGGLSIALVRAASYAAHVPVKVRFAPWSRAKKEVLDGSAFGTFPYRITEERKKDYLFSEPLLYSPIRLLRLKNNPNAKKTYKSLPEDLKGHRIGLIAGHDSVKKPLQEAGVLVEEVASTEQNFIKLERGRIDFYADAEDILIDYLNKKYTPEQRKNFELLPDVLGQEAILRIMVSKQYPDSTALLEKLNRGIKAIQKTGTYNAVLKRHGFPPPNHTQQKSRPPH